MPANNKKPINKDMGVTCKIQRDDLFWSMEMRIGDHTSFL